MKKENQDKETRIQFKPSLEEEKNVQPDQNSSEKTPFKVSFYFNK